MSEPSKKLVFVLSRLSPSGGMERSTLHVLMRLQKMGWSIDVISFKFEGWASETLPKWHRVPGWWIPSYLLKEIWLAVYSWVFLFLYFPRDEYLVATIGDLSMRADVRVIQFFHSGLRRLVRRGQANYPNERTIFHAIYQRIYLAWHCWLEGVLYRKTPQFIAIAQCVEKDLIAEFGIESNRIRVVRHAPEQEIGSVAIKKNNPEPIVLFVGALERKGISKSLDCLAQVADLPWQFWAVGGGNIERWQAKAEDLGLSERVTFFGAQPSKPYFEKSDIFLFPSLYEPFGLVVSEAVSFGLAVLASNECGAMELWAKREFTLNISANDDVQAWVQPLRKLLADKEYRQSTAVHGRESMSAWNWDLAASEYDDQFTKSLGSGAESSSDLAVRKRA